MIAIFRKFPSRKKRAALVIFLGFCAWILPIAAEDYREYKSMERAIDILASECAAHGGCTIETRFDDYYR
jgi:hypothetical protein